MYYIVQENIFKEHHFDLLISTLEKAGLEYEIVKWRPFADDIEFKTNRTDVFCFGSVSMAKAAFKYNWTPGVFYDDSQDMELYLNKYGDYMLNADGACINFGDQLPDNLSDIFFARPIKDSKVFSGGLFSRNEWDNWVNTPVAEGVTSNLNNTTRILVSPLKSYIQKEIRCWVVDGKVVTTSQYKLGKKVIYQNYDYEQEAIDFAQKMVDIYNPLRTYVLDICLYRDEYKIVEINCLNSAGYYAADMYKLITALEDMKFDNE